MHRAHVVFINPLQPPTPLPPLIAANCSRISALLASSERAILTRMCSPNLNIQGSRHLGLHNIVCCGPRIYILGSVGAKLLQSAITLIQPFTWLRTFITFIKSLQTQMMNWRPCAPLHPSPPHPAVTAQKNSQTCLSRGSLPVSLTQPSNHLWPAISQWGHTPRHHVRYPTSTPPSSPSAQARTWVCCMEGLARWSRSEGTRSLTPLWPLL